MRAVILGVLAGLLLAIVPMVAQADDGDKKGFILRIDGDYTLPRGETVGTVVVIGGNAQIDGTVDDALLVIDGDATVSGTVDGDITVIEGKLNLRSGARADNLNLFRSDLERDSGATVTGSIHRRERIAFRGGWLVPILFWVGTTVSLVITALVVAAVTGRQLKTAAQALTQETAKTIIGAVFVWVVGPIVAVLLMLTLIGFPAGLGLLLFVLPFLFIFGYLVTATRLGAALVGFAGRTPGEHPFAAAAVGVIVLQLIVLLPVIGWLIGILSALWGAGAIAFLAYRAARGHPAGLTPGGLGAVPPPVSA